jgi:hypothetical protein
MNKQGFIEHRGVLAAQMNDQRNIDEGFHHACLARVAGDTIEHEPLLVRLESGGRHMIGQSFLPEPHGRLGRSGRGVAHLAAAAVKTA